MSNRYEHQIFDVHFNEAKLGAKNEFGIFLKYKWAIAPLINQFGFYAFSAYRIQMKIFINQLHKHGVNEVLDIYQTTLHK